MTEPAVPAATPKTFQELILRLQQYWAEQGCVLLQPYDMEVGAGTFHPATFLRATGGAQLMCSHHAGRQMVVMAIIPTAYSTIISFRW